MTRGSSFSSYLNHWTRFLIHTFALSIWLYNVANRATFQTLSSLLFTHAQSLPSSPPERKILNTNMQWKRGRTQERCLPKSQNCWYDLLMPIPVFGGGCHSGLSYLHAWEPYSSAAGGVLQRTATISWSCSLSSPQPLAGQWHSCKPLCWKWFKGV